MTLSWHLDVPPADAFDAWVEPDISCNWLIAAENGETSCEFEPPSGGEHKITRVENGQRYVAVGEFLLVDRPGHSSFTFGMPRLTLDFDTIAVEFKPAGGGTELSFNQYGLRPGHEEATLAGWRGIFGLLEAILSGRAA